MAQQVRLCHVPTTSATSPTTALPTLTSHQSLFRSCSLFRPISDPTDLACPSIHTSQILMTLSTSSYPSNDPPRRPLLISTSTGRPRCGAEEPAATPTGPTHHTCPLFPARTRLHARRSPHGAQPPLPAPRSRNYDLRSH